jgi:proteic killer suppression protein
VVLVRFADQKLERLYIDGGYMHGLGANVVKAYRKVVQAIVAAADERDLYGLKSLHYEKLKGDRSHQRSLRLNQQFRLIVELERHNGKTVAIIEIVDYH